MSVNYGQHNGHLDWVRTMTGETSKLASTNLGVYVEEARAKRLRKNNFIFQLQLVYKTIESDLFLSHIDIHDKVLEYIEGMPVDTLQRTWRRWLKYGDKNYLKYLRGELWIEE